MAACRMFRKRLVFLLPICLFLMCSSLMYLFVTSLDTEANRHRSSDVHDTLQSRSQKDIEKGHVDTHGDKTRPKEPIQIVKAPAGDKKGKFPIVPPKGIPSGRVGKDPRNKTMKVVESHPSDKAMKGVKELPKIPHIIHQIWDTADIQGFLEHWVKSWKKIHPKWQYWLWTLEDGHELIKRAFPSFLPLYESYTEDIFRVDALRLFILYAFGGIYTDIDMYSIKPLDPWTYEHQCILTKETYEHSFIVEEKNRTNVVNGFLACRSGHPFYKLAIESLLSFAGEYFGDFLHATGPFFVDAIYQKYNRTVQAKNDSLTVVPPKYFLPTFDPTQEGTVSYKCAPSRYKELPIEGQELCKTLWHRDFANKVGPEAFTNHKWMHLYMYDPSWKTKNTKPLQEMVPTAQNIRDVLQQIDEPLWTE